MNFTQSEHCLDLQKSNYIIIKYKPEDIQNQVKRGIHQKNLTSSDLQF